MSVVTQLSVVAHQLLLAATVLALGAAALRAAALMSGDGLERGLAGLVLSASAVVIESLLLGLAGLGGSAAALAAAAISTWLLVKQLTPPPRVGFSEELASWWHCRRLVTLLLLGAAGGLAGAWLVWGVTHPPVGTDGLTYHLSIAASWVQNGHPGSIVNEIDGVPVANYPLTNEVIFSWLLGISRSWAATSAWPMVLAVAMALGGWVALRELAVAAPVRAAAVTALLSLPLVGEELEAVNTDLATTAWLVVTAALALCARRRPALVHAAILAAALSLGTKTTPALLVVVLAFLAARPLREAARGRPWLLTGTLVVAVGVGGIWPLRNLFDHGSPLWPFVAAPWGDRPPAGLAPLLVSFLSHPIVMLSGRIGAYVHALAGGVALIFAGVLVPLACRSRAAMLGAAVAAVALLAWGLAPATGITNPPDLAVGATRYLPAALAACALALALAARDGTRVVRFAALAALVGATVFSCVLTAQLPSPYVPSPLYTVIGLMLGALGTAAAIATGHRRAGQRSSPRWHAAAALTGVIATTIGLTVGANGFVARHAQIGLADTGILRAEQSLAGFDSGSRPVVSAPTTIALLHGDHLQHALTVLSGDESCTDLRARVRSGLVVLQILPVTGISRHIGACLVGLAPHYSDAKYALYGG